MDDAHVCDEQVVLQRALQVADAQEWFGSTTVNFMIVCNAARTLAKEVRRLQEVEFDR